MEDRIKVGFYYIWDKSWMGGVMYAINLLKALNKLDECNKPYIEVYCRSDEAFEDLKNHTRYPYLGKVVINDSFFLKRLFRKLLQFVFGYETSFRLNMFKINPKVQVFFPYGYGTDTNKLVYWRPDFQEKYMPQLFSKNIIVARDKSLRTISKRGIPIVFSSYDSCNDFKKFYPEYSNKTFVVHFAVEHDDFSYLSIEEVKRKYQITGEYLLCANQFWKHKNHLYLFKAYKKALDQGLKRKLVCTGALSDFRNPEYIQELKNFVRENDLSKNIILPGLIDTDELHCLMRYSYAVVQPSLFEGWNTTVEDCKSMNKFVFLSDLRVHREQAKTNVCFFDPHDEDDLCDKLLSVNPVEEYSDYNCNLRKFGMDFLKVINYVANRQQKR